MRVLVFGGIISPVLGGAGLSARAVPCGAGFNAGSHKRSPAVFGSGRHLASACAPGSSRTAHPDLNWRLASPGEGVCLRPETALTAKAAPTGWPPGRYCR